MSPSGVRARDNRNHALECLSRAESMRDKSTNEHEDLVGSLAGELARALGFHSEQSALLEDAARLHDIGKFALPSDILYKPGGLSKEEWAFVRKHAEIGHDILRIDDSDFLRLAARIAYCHHEHFDGGGYPQGLAGEAIPFEARIVAVADTYEALRADRSYKRGVDHDTAFAIILEGDDRSRPEAFDPQVLRALEALAATFGTRYDEHRAMLSTGDAKVAAPQVNG